MIKWLFLGALAINLLSFFWYASQSKVLSEQETSASLWQKELASEIVLLSELELFPPTRQAPVIEDRLDELPLTGRADIPALASPVEPLLAPTNVRGEQQVDESDGVHEGGVAKALVREQAPKLEAQSDPELQCVIVGHFDKEGDARGLFEEMQSKVGVTAKLNTVVEGLVRYLVYMPPLDTMGMAKERQAQLREAGIRSSLYYKGDLKNGLSLGYFGSRQNAERRYKDLLAAGYRLELKVVETQITRYWLELQAGDDARLSQKFWRDLAQSFPNAGRKEVACSVVE